MAEPTRGFAPGGAFEPPAPPVGSNLPESTAPLRQVDARTQALRLASQTATAAQTGPQRRVLAEPPVSFDVDLRDGASAEAEVRRYVDLVDMPTRTLPPASVVSSALDGPGHPGPDNGGREGLGPAPWEVEELTVVGAGAAAPSPIDDGVPGQPGDTDQWREETAILPATRDAEERRTSESSPLTAERITDGPPSDPKPSSRRSRRATSETKDEPARASRAGRDLGAAIGVGVLLAALVLGSLLFRKEIFVGLASAAVVVALWELAGAMSNARLHVPVVPLGVGALGMLVSAYVTGPEGLTIALALTAFVVLLWRIIDGVDGAARDIAAGIFTAAYVPFLAGFAVLMLAAPDGAMRVIVFMATVVASDIGGYAAGVLFGAHPMAPGLSPKKSWEGFGGSLIACVLVGVAGVVFLLHGPWWAGLILGLLTAVSATVGDLSESVLKRGLGVKDMGNLLPGHGGLMDRLDSLLMSAPVAFLVLTALVST